VARREEAEFVYEEPAPEVWMIVVRLWWEQAGAGESTMRARVTSTVSDGLTAWTGAASTIDGVVDAVRGRVERFIAGPPPGSGFA
jgi:hypothetical protein